MFSPDDHLSSYRVTFNPMYVMYELKMYKLNHMYVLNEIYKFIHQYILYYEKIKGLIERLVQIESQGNQMNLTYDNTNSY